MRVAIVITTAVRRMSRVCTGCRCSSSSIIVASQLSRLVATVSTTPSCSARHRIDGHSPYRPPRERRTASRLLTRFTAIRHSGQYRCTGECRSTTDGSALNQAERPSATRASAQDAGEGFRSRSRLGKAVSNRLRPAAGTLSPNQLTRLCPTIRRHAVLSAAAVSLAFGSLIAASVAAEDGIVPALRLFLPVGACGMFAFLMTAGSYVGLVRPARPFGTIEHRFLDAAVAACIGVLVALAFRDGLWWVVGATPSPADIGPLTSLLALAAASAFVAVLASETAIGTHRGHG